nr:DUF2812 domain-containing protein [uncultured Oscillibacter sp.]
MRDTKYRLNNFCLYDYRGVEEHLSAMAARGWRLEKAGLTFWKYRRAEPAQVRYAVTYSDSASWFNPGPTEQQQSLEELCGAAGWTKVCDWLQMQIFCTADPAAVPLETDEALRLEGIHRSMKKNFIPTNLAALLLLLFVARDFFLALVTGDLYGMVRSNAVLFAAAISVPAVCLQIYLLSGYFLWRRRSRRSVEDGGPCLPAGKGYRRASLAQWGLITLFAAAYLLLELFGGGRGRALYFVLYMTLFYLLLFLVRRTTALLRRMKVSKAANMAWTLAVDVVLAFALVGGLTYTAIHFDWFSSGTGSGKTYEYRGETWDVSPRQDFLLTLAELTGEEYGHVSREVSSQGSLFVSERHYWESALLGDGPKSCFLSYTVYETKYPSLQESMLKDLLKDDPLKFRGMTMFTWRYLPDDPAPWGADAAYRRYIDEDPTDTWLLVWPGRAVGISFDSPTEAQMSTAAAHLKPEA